MTGSQIKRFLCTVAFAALAVPALAQWTDSKPPVLSPEDYPPEATEDPPDHAPAQNPAHKSAHKPASKAANGAPQQLAPGEQPPAADTPAIPAYVPPHRQPAAVEVDSLGTAEGPPVGTLDDGNGGLGDHLWSGSDRAKTEKLLAKAPLVSADPVLRDLVRRAVQTKAPPPPGQAKKAFVTMRIERLLDAGLVRTAGSIAAAATVSNDDDFLHVQAKAVLLANRGADACGPVTATRQTGADAFWLQLRTYCAEMSGDTATAELTRQVLKAQGHGDAAFDSLVESVKTKKPLPPGAIANPTPVHIFLLQQANLPVTEPVARKLGTVENMLAARDSRNSPRARFEAAERIVSTGALKPDELLKIADAQEFPLSKIAGAVSSAPDLPFFMGQVVLRRAALAEAKPEAQAKLIVEALALGEKFKLKPLSAALQADVIAKLKPSPALRPYASEFARALVLAGKSNAAAAWTAGDGEVKVLVALASGTPERVAGVQATLSAYGAALTKNPPAPDADRSFKALALGLFDVTGNDLPADAKAAAAQIESAQWDGVHPGPGQMRTITELAGKPDRRGEAVLLLTSAIHTVGLKDLAPDATIQFVRLLNNMGLTADARALAVEALAQYAAPPPPPPAVAPTP